jgi:hypothetical protein
MLKVTHGDHKSCRLVALVPYEVSEGDSWPLSRAVGWWHWAHRTFLFKLVCRDLWTTKQLSASQDVCKFDIRVCHAK